MKTETQKDYHVVTEAETRPITTISQEMPRADGLHEELGRTKEGFYPESQRKCGY